MNRMLRWILRYALPIPWFGFGSVFVSLTVKITGRWPSDYRSESQ